MKGQGFVSAYIGEEHAGNLSFKVEVEPDQISMGIVRTIDFTVEDEFQRQGVGTALLRYLVSSYPDSVVVESGGGLNTQAGDEFIANIRKLGQIPYHEPQCYRGDSSCKCKINGPSLEKIPSPVVE